MAAQRWLPLESNPESMNRWASSLGLDTNRFSFQDVWGLDDDALGWVKPPVAVLLLFPITAAYEARRLVQDEEIAQNGVEGVADVLYFKQRIANACGTFGLLHALGNCGLPLAEGPLTILFEQAKGKTPHERADLIETSDELEQAHDATAHTGQTAAPSLADEVDLHFVAFVAHKGHLIELDGRRNSPVNHGLIEVDLLRSTAALVQKIMAETDSLNFNLIVLSPTPDEDA